MWRILNSPQLVIMVDLSSMNLSKPFLRPFVLMVNRFLTVGGELCPGSQKTAATPKTEVTVHPNYVPARMTAVKLTGYMMKSGRRKK